MDFGKRAIVVDGEDVEINVKDGLPIADVSKDMSEVASRMAWWSSVYASAVRQLTEADTKYRHWRASAANSILKEDPKAAEWRVKTAIESSPDFVKLKDAIALCEQAVTLAHGMVTAYDKKANALQSRGAMDRSRLKATGMHTRVEVNEDNDEEEDDERDLPGESERVERMRTINKKNRKG